MERLEAEALIAVCLDAVSEQFVLPLALALGTLVAATRRDPVLAQEVAAALHQQASSCAPDVAGRAPLQLLAELADGSRATDADAIRNALRKSLRLIPGGKPPASG